MLLSENALPVHAKCGTGVINGSFVFFGEESPGDLELIGKKFSQNQKVVVLSASSAG